MIRGKARRMILCACPRLRFLLALAMTLPPCVCVLKAKQETSCGCRVCKQVELFNSSSVSIGTCHHSHSRVQFFHNNRQEMRPPARALILASSLLLLVAVAPAAAVVSTSLPGAFVTMMPKTSSSPASTSAAKSGAAEVTPASRPSPVHGMARSPPSTVAASSWFGGDGSKSKDPQVLVRQGKERMWLMIRGRDWMGHRFWAPGRVASNNLTSGSTHASGSNLSLVLVLLTSLSFPLFSFLTLPPSLLPSPPLSSRHGRLPTRRRERVDRIFRRGPRYWRFQD